MTSSDTSDTSANTITTPNKPIITVDGPSGSGKGTLCARLSAKLGFDVLDSGALYRILGLRAKQDGLLQNHIDKKAVVDLVKTLNIVFDYDDEYDKRIWVNGDDVTQTIRTEQVGGYASQVASIAEVRAALLDLQKSFAHSASDKSPSSKGLIADGRDMGTVVFPDAVLKIFLTATAEERAKRRVKQLQEMGKKANIFDILADIKARDERDMNRLVAPLKPADDAIVLDSSSLSIDDVVGQVLAQCQVLDLL